MRKPQSKEKALAAHKRATKRSLRLKKTQADKHIRKAKIQAEKREKAKKFNEMINKMLQARAAK